MEYSGVCAAAIVLLLMVLGLAIIPGGKPPEE